MNREREERLQIMLTMDELRAVDDFRYKTRMPSRAAAVRELLNRGLRALEAGVASTNSRSKDFGVLEIANGSSFETAKTTEDAPKIDTRSSKRILD
jgi:hypothetical protein